MENKFPKSDEGKTLAYWEATEPLIEANKSRRDLETDVCIIGAGIAGLTTAFLLAREGREVSVIDDGLIGGGETCRTTAHLTSAIDDRIYRIEKWHGPDKARLAVQAHQRAIDKIDDIVSDEEISCDFERLDGYLIEAANSDDDLDEELAAAHRMGMSDVEFVPRAPIGDYDTDKCIRFPNQGQFHVLKYLRGLVKSIERRDGKLFSYTRAVEWTGGAKPVVKTANGKTIKCNSLVLATNYPLMSKMFAMLPAYRTYAAAFELPPKTIEPLLLWDTGDPYIYLRVHNEKGRQILIVGGEDHRTGQSSDQEKIFDRLARWVKMRFMRASSPKYKWSGQCLETHDGLAFLGRYSDDEPNVYLITGDSGMGMTHGTIGAMIASDLICGRENPWAEVFDPTRLATQSVKEAIPEVISSTVPYVDWLKGGDVSSEDDLENGDGAIICEGLSKLAVYRDENGKLHKRSAVCTHMGCIVRFNSIEKTWDCPCHGSRFSPDGEPINAPATTPLDEV
ncbi:MAG: FAD-dependent oxidoreductase [Pyrinomonadaceae bacterium]